LYTGQDTLYSNKSK